MRRLLLPCIHGGEARALEVTVSIAHSHQATLVALALLPVVLRRWFPRQSRPEALQQAQDFFEVLDCKAEKPVVSTAMSKLQIEPASVSIACSLQSQQEAHPNIAQTDLWTRHTERIRGSTL